MVGRNKQQQELWCFFTRLFVDVGVRRRHFLCIASYLLAALLLSPDDPEAANKGMLVHPSLIEKKEKWSPIEQLQQSDFRIWLRKR